MQHLSRDRGFQAFAMMCLLFVLIGFGGLIFSPVIIKLTLPWFFGIHDAESFLQTTSEQVKNPVVQIYLQAVTSICIFLVPVIMYHAIVRFLYARDTIHQIGIQVIPGFRYWFTGILIMFMAAIFSQWLVEINTAVHLPVRWQALRSGQEVADRTLASFFSDSSTGRFVLLTIVLGLLPAVAEELCFRGTIQNTLAQTNLGPVGAIITTGLTFSLVHFEFNNFLAIWCMGIVLGCLYYYTGSIWISISAHFFNNFLLLVGKFAFMLGLIHSDLSSNETAPVYLTLPAGILMVLGLRAMRKWSGIGLSSYQHHE